MKKKILMKILIFLKIILTHPKSFATNFTFKRIFICMCQHVQLYCFPIGTVFPANTTFHILVFFIQFVFFGWHRDADRYSLYSFQFKICAGHTMGQPKMFFDIDSVSKCSRTNTTTVFFFVVPDQFVNAVGRMHQFHVLVQADMIIEISVALLTFDVVFQYF